LYIAERKAREQTRLRGELTKAMAIKEKESKEADLRDLAARLVHLYITHYSLHHSLFHHTFVLHMLLVYALVFTSRLYGTGVAVRLATGTACSNRQLSSVCDLDLAVCLYSTRV
jgi:hypothetical protein